MTLTLRDRIVLTLVPLAVLLVILGAAGVVLLSHLGGRIDAILHENYDSIIAMERLNEALERIDSSFQFTLAGQEPKARDQYQQNWPIYRERLRFEQGNITLPGERELVEQLTGSTKRYQEQGDAFYARPATDPRRPQDYFGPEGLLETFSKIKSIAGRISRLNQDNMEQASREAKHTAAVSVTGLAIGLAAAVLLAAISVGLTLRSILKPIKAVTQSALGISTGDLDQVVPYLSRDALGELAEAFNRMAQRLRADREVTQERTEELVRTTETLRQEISEREQMERSLRQLAAIVESSDDAIIGLSMDGVITNWNKGAERVYGHTAERAVGQSQAILVPVGHENELPIIEERIKHGEHVRHFETVRRRKDGRQIYVSLTDSPIKDESGAVVGVASIARDITERKKAEEAVRRASAYNRSLIEASLDPLVTIGPDGKITDVNAATESATGFRRAEILGTDFARYFTEPQKARLGYERVFGEGSVRDYPLEIRHRDGPVTSVLYNASVYRDEFGSVVGVFAAARDITERKRAEEQVRTLARLQTVVAELGQQALGQEPSKNLLDQAVSQVALALDVEYCKVLELLPDGRALLLQAGVGWKEGLVGHATVGSGSDSQAGYTLLSDEPVIVADLRSETRFSGPPLLHEHGVVSGMSVIIATSEGPYGVLGTHTKRLRTFTNDEVHFLQAIANVLGTAIQRQRAEDRLRRINRSHRALSSCNEALIRATDESAWLEQVCRIVVEAAGYHLCWVGYAEKDEARTVRPVAQAGFDDGYLKRVNFTWADTDRGRSPTGTCIRTGQTALIKNVATDPGCASWSEALLKLGITSCIAIPLKADSIAFGALTIQAASPEAFGDAEVELLTELADDLAYGVTTLRTRAERTAATAALREREEHIRLLLDSAAEAICGVDLEGNCTWANQAYARLLGYDGLSAILGKNLHALAHYSRPDLTPLTEEECPIHQASRRGDAVHVDTEVLWRADKTYFPAEYWSHPVRRGGEIIGAVVTFLDITARKAAEAQIEHLAYHDALTELPNRVLFQDRLSQAMAQAKRQHRLVALHFLDLDHFKLVNDSLGHTVGDTLLKAVADRLRYSVRAGDTVARFGGDEFAILQPALPRVEGAATLAAQLLKVISRPFLVNQQTIHTTASIGVTVYPLDDGDESQLLQNADMAMYLAKKEGRNNYQFFTASLHAELQEHMALGTALHQALDRREFVLHYQPIVDLQDERIIANEALIRWQHPDRGLLMPGKFLAVTEEAGLIVPVGTWVLQQGCAQNRAWQAAGQPPRRIAINISAAQLKQDKFVATVAETIQMTGLAPQWLELELTETTLLQDLEAATRTMQELHQLGVQLSIDDFGTGYSSLSYLSRFPVDKLKIDQSFVRNLPEDPDSAVVAKAIIDLGHCLGMKVIAEGVETKEQLDYLRANGCDEAQGYYFGRPGPASAPDRSLGKNGE